MTGVHQARGHVDCNGLILPLPHSPTHKHIIAMNCDRCGPRGMHKCYRKIGREAITFLRKPKRRESGTSDKDTRVSHFF